MPQNAPLRFVSPAPDLTQQPVPFSVVMRDRDGAEVEGEFLARPRGSLSFGQLLDLTTRPELDMVLGTFEKVCVRENSHPADKDDGRSEYERLRDLLLDEDLYIDQSTLLDMVRGLSELYAERPTVLPAPSPGTPRPGHRGSTAKRAKRATH